MNDPIESLSWKLAVKAKSWNDEIKIPAEVISYHLAIWINYYGVLVMSALIGLATGTILEVLTAFFTLAFLRAMTGGAHAPTLSACFAITLFTITLASQLAISDGIIVAITYFNALSVLWYNKNRTSSVYTYGSIALVASNFVFYSPAMAIASFAQCLSLINYDRGWTE